MTASMKQQHFWEVYTSYQTALPHMQFILLNAGIHNIAEIDRQKQATNAPSSIY